ncbi:hypothetical protein [Flammeovirga sp. SJP92]|uniref:hypothetical protein n=1 Tax=Flammeovirga sp. SJP92 TaxID=1775430 RepID=UPI000786C13A|nr:hypothetical protein [Flammeovirga sp. SJP92]KXX67401.1 hypothetical protein AVL50_26895 [Flammeovirga sp. SJP92]
MKKLIVIILSAVLITIIGYFSYKEYNKFPIHSDGAKLKYIDGSLKKEAQINDVISRFGVPQAVKKNVWFHTDGWGPVYYYSHMGKQIEVHLVWDKYEKERFTYIYYKGRGGSFRVVPTMSKKLNYN